MEKAKEGAAAAAATMAFNPYEIFEVKTREENEVGIWAEYPIPGHPKRGFRVRFVHAGETNPVYREALRARMKPLNFRVQQDMVSDEEFESIQHPVYADRVIKEWESKDENGQYTAGIYGPGFAILPVNRENIVSTFTAAPRLFKDIKKQAENFATFRRQELEVDAKK